MTYLPNPPSLERWNKTHGKPRKLRRFLQLFGLALRSDLIEADRVGASLMDEIDTLTAAARDDGRRISVLISERSARLGAADLAAWRGE